MNSHNRRRWSIAVPLSCTLATGLLVAACSSSAHSSGSPSPAAGGKAPTVETHSGPMGTFLTDASGRSLYLFAADTGPKSTCSGACATVWPPLTVSGSPTAAGATKANMLGTITRADGRKQVTYAGHPLYTYAADSAAGDTSGEGSNGFGAKWWLVAPSGQPITSTASGGSPSSSTAGSTSGGGGGGWS